MEQTKVSDRMALSMNEFARVMGISRTKAFQMAKVPGFPTVRLGKRMVVPIEQLRKWLEEQSKSKEA